MPALALEEEMKNTLCANRGIDAAMGRTQEGAHRADFIVMHDAKVMPAAQCSTGEQKGMLVAIILAHALMMQAEKGYVPIILLDEVAAHLDDARREFLFSFLSGMNGQVWLTGTDAGIFSSLENVARFYEVGGGQAQSSSLQVESRIKNDRI
jgi:DNA replication and repair protein RecF